MMDGVESETLESSVAPIVVRVLQLADDQGGHVEGEVCAGRSLGPARAGRDVRPSDHTTFCALPARFTVPYLEGEGAVTACVVDDRADLWPRFEA